MKKIHYALILVCFLSCEAVFLDDLSNDTVVLLAPLDNAQLDVGNNTFSWELLDNAETYQIQIATPSFANANQIVLDSVTSLRMLIHDLSAGTYQWRIKALNSEYETPFSTVDFTVN
ncbi:MAG: hypothetical protein JKY02_09190 [Flavobacteriaceae bacterium]|nr:hypothetical protein [Flavobacteriaceae bacterium]